MGLVTLMLVGFAAWLAFTGRLRRLAPLDAAMLGVSIVSAVVTARGQPLIGGLPLALTLLYALRRITRLPAARTPATSPLDEKAVREARALLGLDEYADSEAIRTAHRRLIAKIHPDAGGTEALAEKINEARAILLRDVDERKGRNRPSSNGSP